MKRHVITLAKWLASKAIKAEWKSQGHRAEIGELAKATNVYFMEHRRELIEEAWEHPVAMEYRHKERMRLARKAVIAEIRDRGQKVNSIEPAELRRLIEAYVKEHPTEAFMTIECC